MKKEPIVKWNEKTGETYCYIHSNHNNKIYSGSAFCHPDDMDMKNKFTGYNIATKRATIKALVDYRDSEIKPSLKALK